MSSKYRFNWSVIGHQAVVNFLQQSIIRRRLSHAYLLVGPKRVGKETVAEFFVQSLFCFEDDSSKNTLPCGKCDQCRQVANKVHPEIIYISPELGQRSITIEQIRGLIEKFSLTSMLNTYKVAVLNGAESLEEPAANALLKTLEEPQGRSMLILLAESVESLPATIISRCQQLNFLPVSSKDIISYFKNQNLQLSQVELEQMARASQGRVGQVFIWLNSKHLWGEFKERIIAKIELLDQKQEIAWQLSKKIFTSTRLFNEKMEKLQLELDEWINLLRDVVLIKIGMRTGLSYTFATGEIERFAHYYPLPYIQQLLNWLFYVRKNIRHNPRPELIIDNILLQLKV